METQRGLLWRPTPLTGWGVSIAAPKGMRRAPRRVRLRVISNGGFAPKPPCQQLLAWGLGGKAPILESRSRPTGRGAHVWLICC